MMIFMMIFGLEKKLGTNSNRRTAGPARPLNQSAFLRFILRRQNAVQEMLFKKCFSKNGFLKNADAFFDSDFAAFHGPANHNIWVLFRPKTATFCGNLVNPHNIRLCSRGRPKLHPVIQGRAGAHSIGTSIISRIAAIVKGFSQKSLFPH